MPKGRSVRQARPRASSDPRSRALAILQEDDAFWRRAVKEFYDSRRLRRPSGVSRIAVLARRTVRHSAAIERFDAHAEGDDQRRAKLVSAYLRSLLAHRNATTLPNGRDVPGWVEITAQAVRAEMEENTATGVAKVTGQWIRWLLALSDERRQASAGGMIRAQQRRDEAESHRWVWRDIRSANPKVTKAAAAQAIASICKRAGRGCAEQTVLGHLKGRTKSGQ